MAKKSGEWWSRGICDEGSRRGEEKWHKDEKWQRMKNQKEKKRMRIGERGEWW